VTVRTRTAPFGAVVLLSVVVLFMPASGTPAVYPGLDKLVHLGLFAALALTGWWAGVRPAALAGGLVAYAGASEVLQAVLPIGRDATWGDALADVAGAAVGLLAARLIATRRAGRA
jgi:VanZ family protein